MSKVFVLFTALFSVAYGQSGEVSTADGTTTAEPAAVTATIVLDGDFATLTTDEIANIETQIVSSIEALGPVVESVETFSGSINTRMIFSSGSQAEVDMAAASLDGQVFAGFSILPFVADKTFIVEIASDKKGKKGKKGDKSSDRTTGQQAGTKSDKKGKKGKKGSKISSGAGPISASATTASAIAGVFGVALVALGVAKIARARSATGEGYKLLDGTLAPNYSTAIEVPAAQIV